MTADHVRALRNSQAPTEFVRWAESQPTMRDVWRHCQRGDWLLGRAAAAAGRPGTTGRRRLVMAVVDCARLIEHLDPSGAAQACLDAAEGHVQGAPGIDAEAVWAAADGWDASDAPERGGSASLCAWRAAWLCAVAAVHESAGSAYAVALAVADATVYVGLPERAPALARCADITRWHFPVPPTYWRPDYVVARD